MSIACRPPCCIQTRTVYTAGGPMGATGQMGATGTSGPTGVLGSLGPPGGGGGFAGANGEFAGQRVDSSTGNIVFTTILSAGVSFDVIHGFFNGNSGKYLMNISVVLGPVFPADIYSISVSVLGTETTMSTMSLEFAETITLFGTTIVDLTPESQLVIKLRRQGGSVPNSSITATVNFLQVA